MDMGFFNKYPYTDFHELNLDWVIATLKQYLKELQEFVQINAIKYADPIQWDIQRQYEKNTVVIDPLNGTAYISVQAVPAGVSLSRPEYWSVIFDLSLFITAANNNFTVRVEPAATTTATFATAAGEWVIWDQKLYKANVNITAGDAYVEGGNITRWTVEESIQALSTLIAALDTKVGDLADLTTTDKSSIVNAINDVVSALTTVVNNIGDLTTLTTLDQSSIVNAINELVTNLSTLTSNVGNLASLTTVDQSSIVNAINELVTNIGTLSGSVTSLANDVGSLASLTTVDQSSIVNAINELVTNIGTLSGSVTSLTSDIGTLSSLTTTDQSNLVNAINEVNAKASSAAFTTVNLSDFGLSAGDDISNIINTYASPLTLFVLDKDYQMGDIQNKYININGNGSTITLNGTMLINNDSTHPYDIFLMDLTVDFNSANFNGSFILTHGGNLTALRCTFTNTGTGSATACIGSGGNTRASYISCTFTNVRQGIYELSKGWSYIYGCTFDNVNVAILLTSAENVIISMCSFDNMAEYGVLMGSTSYDAGSYNILIDNCTFQNQTGSAPAYNKPITYANQLPNMNGFFIVRDCVFDTTSGIVSIQGAGLHYDYRARCEIYNVSITNPTSDIFYLHNADMKIKGVKITQSTTSYDQIRMRYATIDIDGYELTYTGGTNLDRFITMDAVATEMKVKAKNIKLNTTFTNYLIGGQPTGNVEVIIDNLPGDFTTGTNLLSQSEIFNKIYLRCYPSGLSSPDTRAYPKFDNIIGRIYKGTDGTMKMYDGSVTKTITTT